MLYPLTFHPILKERVWGGRNLEQLYNKDLPAGVPIGESWEISDRGPDISVIANGSLAGKTLHWAIERHGPELLGSAKLQDGNFPLLIKILDAQEKLSLQVHPPASQAAHLGGEPKTEMWYIAQAAPDAELYVGLKRGVSREQFAQKLRTGTVAECFHQVRVRAGDAMFLPSGRVHAIGAGLVIFEIQQNSDTTYRVYDWGRMGLDGKPRDLHVAQSLASIDFGDFEPVLVAAKAVERQPQPTQRLVADPLFTVDLIEVAGVREWRLSAGTMHILGVLSGELQIGGGNLNVALRPGQFCLLPAALDAELLAPEAASFLSVTPGS